MDFLSVSSSLKHIFKSSVYNNSKIKRPSMKISSIFIVIPLLLMATRAVKGRFLLVRLDETEDGPKSRRIGLSSFVQDMVDTGKYFQTLKFV